jgi:hypothetical protein
MGHGENAARVMAEAGGELSGKVRRDWCGQIIGDAQCGVAALDDDTGNDAILGKARINGFCVFCFPGAFGETDEVGAHKRCAGEKKFGREGAAGRGKLGVESVGQSRGSGSAGEEKRERP